ncbi:MAG: NAD-dependent succinate-semialdehyde dehydrogenase [Flavobacteriales bacterium]
MEVVSINPWNLEEIERFKTHTNEETDAIIRSVDAEYQTWRKTSFADRTKLLMRVADILNERKDKYAAHITAEMGKPIVEAVAEVQKCAWVCRFYAEQAESFLKPRAIETDASKSFVTYSPLGVIYAIMPWNFPFWQVFRFAAPTLMAGNTAILKHAPNVTRCALDIEEIFRDAGYPANAFRTLILDNSQASQVIEHPLVRAVSLTGSEKAGEAVASTAGRVLKPSVLELGGSNAVIVLEDVDLDQAVDVGFRARFLNSGQSCIAGKRFLVVDSLYDQYIEKFAKKVAELQFREPTDSSTKIGPLARVDLAEGIERQVNGSIAKGAKLLMGGKRDGAKYDATILTEVKPGMPAFDEELFGPVAPFVRVKDFDEAIKLSNQSSFGLGATICTGNPEKALERIHEFDEGAVFINELVKSDPRLPFGGIKRSGFGRELSAEGILEFVNAKTVYVK